MEHRARSQESESRSQLAADCLKKISGGESRPKIPAAWWVMIGGVNCPSGVVVVELL